MSYRYKEKLKNKLSILKNKVTTYHLHAVSWIVDTFHFSSDDDKVIIMDVPINERYLFSPFTIYFITLVVDFFLVLPSPFGFSEPGSTESC
jgi:hypothetical protein